MIRDPNIDAYAPPRVNALAQLSGPGPTMRPMQVNRGARLAARGYEGPLPGTPEFEAARAAGQHPIADWRMAQQPRWEGAHLAPGWNAQGFGPPQAMAPRFQTQGIAYGEPNGQNALAALSGARRRPMQLPRK